MPTPHFKAFGLLLCCLLLALPTQAQDSLQVAEKPKFKLLIGFDSRNTILNREAVGITGLRIGLKKHKYAFGVGYYDSRFLGILGGTVTKPFQLDAENSNRTVPADIDFRYITSFAEYYLIKKPWLILAANTQAGAGLVNIAYDLDEEPREERLPKVLIEHTAKLTVRPIPWLELSAGAGYRYVIGGEKQVRQFLTAPVYSFGGWIYFGKLYKKLKGKKDVPK